MRARRGALTGPLLVAWALLGASACNPDSTPGPQGDSHTNWLRRCGSDAECGDLSCVCGACTRACSRRAECGDAPDYACFGAETAGAVAACAGTAPPGAGMCLPSCEELGCAPGSSCLAGACVPDAAPTVQVEIDPATRLQTLVGFGATVGYSEDELSAVEDRGELDAALFDGLGLDVLRFRNRYGEVSNAKLQQAESLVQAATARLGRRPLVLLGSWSPPASLKQNGATFCGSGPATCTLNELPDGGFDYPGLARHWRASLEAYAQAGLVPDYVAIQNNPDWAPVAGASAEACKLLPSEGTETVTVGGVRTQVRYPGYAEALEAVRAELAQLPTIPKLLAPDLVGPLGADEYLQALAPTRIDAIAHHLYGSDAAHLDVARLTALGQLQAAANLPLFQTEMQADGFDTAVLLHHALVSEGAAMYLQTALVGARSGPTSNPMALVGLESGRPVPQDPYFAMRHYARYTDPGFTRVAASSTDPTVLSSAWLSPEGGALTVVLVNAGLSTQAVSLDVGDRRAFSLSRTVFDGRERMAELGTMTSGASITLPPRSVATARFE